MVKVVKSGFYSTIQDLGRYGYQDYGVPVSGAMDQYSAQFANLVLNNNTQDAVFEMTMTGPTLEFNCHTSICISGADMSPKLNDLSIKMNSVIAIKPNDSVSFGTLNYGFRSYLAVVGGFQTQSILNSRSMFKTITAKFKIEANDDLLIAESKPIASNKYAVLKYNSTLFTSNRIEVFKGPEFELLTPLQQKQLCAQDFTISNLNDRMAYQFKELFKNDLKPILTAPVLPGTIQLTPSGNLIVLMRDCQTTGGYPRILQLKESSINCLAQKFTGHGVRFQLLD
ncbi:biotin-dependent carboxyltransferase family protein [Flavobacteriaceae bacterium LMO-SS05]